jgi:DNA-binding winged helix-turn-helix (wHTH) protein/TolB-like protein/tetratricopeptide (TPR) repeat protein
MAEKWPTDAAGRTLLFNGYELDRLKGCLLRRGTPVHLRPQAYEVLDFLAARAGRLVTKDALIAHVWRGRAVGDDSLVQCLRDVRQALGDEGGRIIRNVRGRGYIFDPGTATAAQPGDAATAIPEPAAAVPSAAPSGRRGHLAAGILAVVTLASVGYAVFFTRPAAPPIGSIAVMPLTNDTGDADADYLADGTTEAFIDMLARIPTLSVKAWTVVSAYKGSKAAPGQVARDLGVAALLYGRIARQGNDLSLRVSLVDGASGNQLWGDRYTGIAELPRLQRQVALGVERALRTGLSAEERGTLAAGYTVDGDAYLLYLRGRYHSHATTEAGMRQAIDYYEQAIRVAPDFAPAYAAMAEAYRSLSIVGQLPSMEAFPQARRAATRALELDSRLPEAHVALGWIGFSFDWDWAAAEQQFKTAVALNPQSPEAHFGYAHLLSNWGRHAEALVEIARARDLDPRSPIINMLEGQMLFYASRLDAAEARHRKVLEIVPDYWPAHLGIGRVDISRGRLPEAIAAIRTSVAQSSNAIEPLTQLGYALAASGNRAGADDVLGQLTARAADGYVPAYSFAMISNGLGNDDDALRYLEQSVVQREVQATFIKIDSRWDRLRPNPRFVQLLRTLHLN